MIFAFFLKKQFISGLDDVAYGFFLFLVRDFIRPPFPGCTYGTSGEVRSSRARSLHLSRHGGREQGRRALRGGALGRDGELGLGGFVGAGILHLELGNSRRVFRLLEQVDLYSGTYIFACLASGNVAE